MINRLRDGDLRSIGRVAEVIERIGDDPARFDALFAAMFSDEPVVQMRAADAVEKISRKHAHLLQPHKAELLGELPAGLRQEVYWHIPLLLPRLSLTDEEWELAWAQIVGILHSGSRSRIVVVNCLQGLVDLALQTEWRREEAAAIVRGEMEMGSPAIRARGRKLLAVLEKETR
jgi:hypothetical protein